MAKLLLTSGFLLFLRIGAYLCLEFNADADTVKGATVSLVCTIDPASFTTFIFLTKDGGSKTSCDNANVCTPASSDAGRYVYSSNSSAVTVTITSLNHTSDAGIWRCTLGTTSTLKDYTLEIQSVPGTVVIQQTIPEANVTTNVKRVDLSATCYCIFPAPTEVDVLYKFGTGGSYQILQRVSTPTPSTGSSCLSYEFEITVSNYTISVDDHAVLSGKTDVYLQVQFGQYTTAGVGPFQFAVSTPTPDECPLFQYAFWPCFCIVLVGTLLVIGVSYRVGKDSKLQESSLKQSCGCCPSDNKFCMAVCPLCTDALCTGSKKTALSTTAKNVISVVVFLIVAAVIGVIIAFGLGVDSGKCTLALILSIVCGLVLVEIFTVSVYPHWPCLPEKGENGGNCFRTCRISTAEEPNRPAGNQASPNRDTSRSSQASASEVRLTTEGRSPRPLPAIGSEAKQLPPISYEESTLKKKPLNATLPEIPKSNKLPPVDTVNNEEDKPKKRKKRKKKREGEENDEEDKRDSQNSGGQANVEEED